MSSNKLQPLVSVIVPVYNVEEQYLKVCLDSILTQDYHNIEIIIIDDGSNIKTATKCDEYASLDNRIHVYHQKNSGVSVARNLGTKKANGQYIMYVDADDILSQSAISSGIEIVIANKADMVIGAIRKIYSYDEFDMKKSEKQIMQLTSNNFDMLRHVYFNDQTVALKIFYDNGGCINRGPYSRIIKTEIAKKNPFPEGFPLGEDAIWNLRLLNLCKRISISNQIWYGYLIHVSTIRKYFGNREELVSKYLLLIENENKDFCKRHPASVAKNIAIEFYCILNYELLSPMCPLSIKEKNRLVKTMLSKTPWKKLRKIDKRIPYRYRLLMFIVNCGLWVQCISIKNYLKNLRLYLSHRGK